MLWKYSDDYVVQIIKGGVKTHAGKDRIVPIHPAIRDFAASFKEKQPKFKAHYFRRYFFHPKMEELGISKSASGSKHTPHDCRHTFSWLCDVYQVDDLSKHLLMGHSLGTDIEKNTYGHRTYAQLKAEIEKIEISRY